MFGAEHPVQLISERNASNLSMQSGTVSFDQDEEYVVAEVDDFVLVEMKGSTVHRRCCIVKIDRHGVIPRRLFHFEAEALALN